MQITVARVLRLLRMDTTFQLEGPLCPPLTSHRCAPRVPHRADAARNFDALVAAARDVLTEYGVDAADGRGGPAGQG